MTRPGPSNLPETVFLPVVPPTQFFIFGAGDDAQPVARIAHELGWKIQVADGRSHLAKRSRFPYVHRVHVLQFAEAEGGERRELVTELDLAPNACAVVLTHSYDQDQAILERLLQRPLRYLGVLGPLHRTRRIVESMADRYGLSAERCLERLHAPMGLKIGSGAPGLIALSIMAEIQAELVRVRVHCEDRLAV